MPDQTQQQDPSSQHDQPDTEAESTQPHPGTTGGMDEQPDHGEKSYQGSGRLQDKRAVVTGGDSGIGRAVALAFAREGADVVLAYLPDEEDDAQETVRLVEDAGRKAVTVPGDLTDEQQCQQLIDTAVHELGGIDILVNNAAYQMAQPGGIEDITTEQWDRVMKTNLYAMFWLSKAAVPHLPEGGSIINTGSITGLEGSKQLLDYSATKGAIHAFTKSLAQNLVDKKIRVNCVSPGPVWTPLNPSDKTADKVARFGADTPMKRPAQPEEIAPAFVFFASNPDSSYITGEVLTLLGGDTTAA